MRRSNWTIFRGARQVAVLVALGVPTKPLLAATTTYTSAYIGGTIVPGDTVLLNDGATVTGNVIDNGTLQYNQSGTTLTITSTISGTGTLSLTNTGTLNLNSANPIVLDMTTTVSSGLLQMRSGGGNLVVGNSGTGTMNIVGGSVTNYVGTLGASVGSVGAATVSSGTWANGWNLYVGDSGAGTLNVTGGSVTDATSYLGTNASSVGTVTVTGGTWATAATLYVGYAGNGTLNVTSGRVSNGDAYLGFLAGSVYSGTVSGGTWASSGILRVGHRGTGTLTIDGGVVTNTSAVLGNALASSVGSVTVSSGTWASSGDVTVGVAGTGTLNVTGGLVTVGGTLSTGPYGSIVIGNGGTTGVLLGGTGGVVNNGGIVFNRSDATTYSGVISGTGTLTKQGTGTLTLSGNSSYTGGTTISDGVLQVGAGGTTGSVAGDLVNNASLSFNRSNASAYAGVISGIGTLTKQGAGTLTLSGNNSFTGGTTINDGVLALGSANAVGTSGTITFGGGTLQYSASNTTDYSSRFSTSASQAYEIDTNGQNVTLASPLSSSAGTFTKFGAGTLTLSGNSSYTGGTTISDGVLQVGAGGTTGSVAGDLVNNASLSFNRSNASAYAGVISGIGTLTKQGAGTLTLLGNNSFTGGTTINDGVLALGSANAVGTSGTITFGGGTLRYSASNTADYSSRFSTAAGQAYEIDTNGQDVTLASPLSSSGGTFTKLGTGTLTLSGNNSYTGGTTIKAGAVAIPAGGSISHGGADLTIGESAGDSASFAVSGGSVTNVFCSIGLNAGSSGSATITSGTWANAWDFYIGNSGTGTLTMNGGKVTSLDGYIGVQAGSVGTVTVSSGTWTNDEDLAVGFLDGIGTLNVNGGSVFDSVGYIGFSLGASGTAVVSSGTWCNYNSLTIGNVDASRGTLNVTGGSVISGTGILGFGVNSVGTATVSSGTWANSGDLTVGYDGTGTLTVSGGLVMVGGTLSKGPHGAINLNAGGTLQMGVGGTGGVLLGGTGSLTNNGTLIFNRSDASIFSGAVSGSGAVTKSGAGTLTLSGSNSYTGGTTISDGVLQVGAGGTTGSIAGNVVNSAALVFSRSNDATFSGVISGTGGLTKQGGGMLTFSGNNSYTGGTTISDGVLQVGAGGTTGSLAGNAVNNSTIVFNRSNALTYSGVISGTGSIRNAGTGTTTLTGQTSFAVPLVATAGRLIVGSTASVNGFSTSGNLTTASGATLELKSKGLAYVNGLSTLTGGTIRAANGISLGAGANVVGTGVISGFVSAAYGSRAEADGGKLTVGDSSSYVGFASAGLLYTNANEVELLDRNLAVLGALTQLGDGSAAGTLRAANGMLLEQGKNLVGRGTVYGTFVNQGDVYGDGSAAGQQIIFAAGSTVSGIGSFENVVFDGTYSPGNSPAITNLTNGQFSSASSLLIELGGTQPGTQYDRVVDSGVLTLLGGTLDVVLYNGFVPSFGDRFEILQYGQLSGDFGTVSYPALSGGLSWERTTSATAMAITVVPEPSTYAIAAIATAGLAGLMRWRRRPGPRLS